SPLAAYCLFPLADVVAEHRAYITALGAVIILAFVVSSMPRDLLISCLLISAFALQTRARNAVWNDDELLSQDAALQAPDKPRPIGGRRKGRFEEAQALLYRANELSPYQPMVHHNLGDVFVNKGQLEKAMIEYTRELQVNPNSLPTHLNLAKTYDMAGFREKSIEHYRILLRADPNNREAHDALTRLQ